MTGLEMFTGKGGRVLIARCLAIAPIAVIAAINSGAAASTIDISAQVNRDLNGYTNGGNYPHGGSVTIGGIGFDLAPAPPPTTSDTGVVQTGFGAPLTFTFGVNETGVTTVYTIINSSFGTASYTVGRLTFTGSAGDLFNYDLTEGQNIRDHATTGFNVLAPDVYATANYPGDIRLDVQKITLPSVFATQDLLTISFSLTDGVPGHGLPFLAAITTATGSVAPVPLPASAPMFGAALIAVAGLGYGLNRRASRAKDAVA